MKLPLKLITLLVLVSLTGIFLYQGYWLLRLYNTLSEEMERNIHLAIQISDYNEMMMRIEDLKNSELTGVISTHVGMQNDTAVVKTESVTNKDTLSSEAMLRTNDGIGLILQKNQDVEALQNYFQKGLHAGLDSYIDLNLERFDSLLTLQLASHGITSPHLTQQIYLPTDTAFVEVIHEISSDTTYIFSSKARHYDRLFDMHNHHGYRIWMEPTYSIVRAQMAGILTTSAVILLILSFSFWYLIRTLLRQKTLEEMKSDFTNNITHELKTPIAVAYAANDALLHFNQAENKEKREKYLRICQEQLERLSRLVEQILGMSMEQRRTFRLDKQPVLLKELVTDLLEQHRLKADKPICFDSHIQPADLKITADRTHLGNILSNLIDNAVKYSMHEAHISLRTQETPQGIEIIIQDRGIGIATEKQKYIFDKFYRIPTGNLHEVKGYGLGLYYVRTLMRKHGGEVYMANRQGGGSVFTLQFPHPKISAGNEIVQDI